MVTVLFLHPRILLLIIIFICYLYRGKYLCRLCLVFCEWMTGRGLKLLLLCSQRPFLFVFTRQVKQKGPGSCHTALLQLFCYKYPNSKGKLCISRLANMFDKQTNFCSGSYAGIWTWKNHSFHIWKGTAAHSENIEQDDTVTWLFNNTVGQLFSHVFLFHDFFRIFFQLHLL